MFVVIEGPNGAGKTSLIKKIESKGCKTLSSPNGTPLAKMLRPACRGTEPWEDIDKTIQFMLFSAARFDEYIRLVHGKDGIVVADRWWTSTYVYQCVLQGLSVNFLEYTVHPEEKIDLVIVLDGDDDVLLERVNAERAVNDSHGRCTWTKDDSIQRKLMSIYRKELVQYLKTKNIAVEVIDTSTLSQDEVLEKAIALIEAKNNVIDKHIEVTGDSKEIPFDFKCQHVHETGGQ